MLIARASRHSAILCALLLAICTLASYPFAEMGGNDDFAYVRSAKALADTGHLVYFGWSSAMLGWQLALGALFIKLFGSYFTATRDRPDFHFGPVKAGETLTIKVFAHYRTEGGKVAHLKTALWKPGVGVTKAGG